jgi:AcrR family transcriptional regulator
MPLTILEPTLTDPSTAAAPPRERILSVARDLFYRYGVHAVGVDAIAEAAGTNKMTLYRHFTSKDELIAECLRRLAAEIDAARTGVIAAHAGNPKGALLAWLRHLAAYKTNEAQRGCAFVNAAIELPDPQHPARRVVEDYKRQARERLVGMCRDAALDDPDLVADEIFLLCEGALVSLQSVGPTGPAARLAEMLQEIVARHACGGQG